VSAGASHHECNTVSDIRETLDQLDRRLEGLRRQVAALFEEPQQAAPLPPPPSRHLHSVPAPPVDLTDLEAALGLTDPPEQGGVPEPDRGNTSAPEAPGDAGAEISTDPGELMAVREQLMAGARELARAYERQLGLLEQMALSGLPATSAQSPAIPSAPPADPPATTGTLAGLIPSPADAVDQARPAFFEGRVDLIVSGAHRIQTIQVLEDALSRARNVDYVYVRRCHRGQVRLELSIGGGAELLGELNRVLPFPFAVTSATGTEIALSLEEQQ
jgi:hypothetical protein